MARGAPLPAELNVLRALAQVTGVVWSYGASDLPLNRIANIDISTKTNKKKCKFQNSETDLTNCSTRLYLYKRQSCGMGDATAEHKPNETHWIRVRLIHLDLFEWFLGDGRVWTEPEIPQWKLQQVQQIANIWLFFVCCRWNALASDRTDFARACECVLVKKIWKNVRTCGKMRSTPARRCVATFFSTTDLPFCQCRSILPHFIIRYWLESGTRKNEKRQPFHKLYTKCNIENNFFGDALEPQGIWEF